jgi:predicted NAD-dependent protein-ADP-ribosyltransferase YbiA (DUF1768 family)
LERQNADIVVEEANWLRCSRNPELKEILLATEKRIE